MLALLTRMVEIESPSHDPSGPRAVHELLAPILGEDGFRCRRIAGRKTGGQLLAVPGRRRRGSPVQLLIGHCDTVWPRGTLATMPVGIEAGRMTGPGIYDMKAGVLLMIYALRALRAAGIEPGATPVLLINSDEEIGSPESRLHIGRLARIADRVLVLEPAAGDSGRIKTARKGVAMYEIRIRAAAVADVHPVLELSLLVQQIFALNDPAAGLTVNVGTIDGGVEADGAAREASATVDVRVISSAQAIEMGDKIRALRPSRSGIDYIVSEGASAPPLERTPGNRRLWRIAREAGRELGLELEEALVGGGSDGNQASQFAPTLDGLGAVGGGAHAAHEFIRPASLIERGALLALLLAAPPLGDCA
jgi:glutamate carboxypeptidase